MFRLYLLVYLIILHVLGNSSFLYFYCRRKYVGPIFLQFGGANFNGTKENVRWLWRYLKLEIYVFPLWTETWNTIFRQNEGIIWCKTGRATLRFVGCVSLDKYNFIYPSSQILFISSKTNEAVLLGEHDAKQRKSGKYFTWFEGYMWMFRKYSINRWL